MKNFIRIKSITYVSDRKLKDYVYYEYVVETQMGKVIASTTESKVDAIDDKISEWDGESELYVDLTLDVREYTKKSAEKGYINTARFSELLNSEEVVAAQAIAEAQAQKRAERLARHRHQQQAASKRVAGTTPTPAFGTNSAAVVNGINIFTGLPQEDTPDSVGDEEDDDSFTEITLD